MYLSSEQIASYVETGYLVVEGLLPGAAVMALGERLREYTHGGRSRGDLAVQIEPRVLRGEASVSDPGDGIRKIDGLVQFDDRFRALGLNANIVGVVSDILGPDIKMFRNSLLLKPPEVGSAKGWHQDSPYWPIEPMDLCSCWFPLDDATLENGCMWVVPGDHVRGPLGHVYVKDDYIVAEGLVDPKRAVAVPMRAGSGLFFHSLLPHYTAPNGSRAWRRAIVLTYMSSTSRFMGKGETPHYFHVKGATYPGCVR